MKHTIKNIEDLDEFMETFVDKEKYIFNLSPLPNEEGFQIQWIEMKSYTAYDGQVFLDEAWVTEDKRMMLIQDIEPEHCRNIIRMMLRKEREVAGELAGLAQGIIEAIGTIKQDINKEVEVRPVLH